MRAFDDYLHDIEAGRPFASTKINHAFWELLVRIERLKKSGVTDPAELARRTNRRAFFETGFFGELMEHLASLAAGGRRVELSATPYAYDESLRISGRPRIGLKPTMAAIEAVVPPECINDGGMLWRRAVYDGSIVRFFQALRARSVILVGPPWLQHFGAFAKIGDFTHRSIAPMEAYRDRHELLGTIVAADDAAKNPVYLLQAGTYATWLAFRLSEALHEATILDLGLVLDICYEPAIKSRDSILVRRRDVAATIVATNPQWPGDERFYEPGTPAEERAHRWMQFRDGVLPEVKEIAKIAVRSGRTDDLDRPSLEAAPVQYIENKRLDLTRIGEILALSRDENRWANFGPVSRALEAVLARVMKLPETRGCVVCASATVALFALAGLHAFKAGRRLRWVTSAYAFHSLRLGPFAGVTVVDCDRTGFIDLRKLDRLPASMWDGLVVTNLFGLKADLEEYRRFAADRGKKLIVDGAAALFGVDRSSSAGIDEAISFHQTKPWGVGEGGCAIVAAGDVDLMRSLLNFGVGLPRQSRSGGLTGWLAWLAPDWPANAHRFAMNGKISDLAAAAILERIERSPSWGFFYRQQQERIQAIAKRAGVRVLVKPPKDAILAGVPLLARGPVSIGNLPVEGFVVRKYYSPLARKKHASRIYGRIVNVPCHPGMAAIPDEALDRLFEAMADAGRPGKEMQ